VGIVVVDVAAAVVDVVAAAAAAVVAVAAVLTDSSAAVPDTGEGVQFAVGPYPLHHASYKALPQFCFGKALLASFAHPCYLAHH
jgi:hypothetical protein